MQSLARVQLFDDPNVTILLDDSFRLERPYFVRLDDDYHCIPEGFVTDLGSIPRVPVVYLLLGGRGHKAAIVHDWLYRTGFYTQEVCDYYYYLLLRLTKIDYPSAWAMHKGLQIGGHKAYNAYAMARAEVAKNK
jgi:hypothetical protein